MPLDGIGFDPIYAALDRAEAIIRRDGWRKAGLGLTGAPRCVIGAIQQAVADMGLVTAQQSDDLRWDACKCYGEAIGVHYLESQRVFPGAWERPQGSRRACQRPGTGRS
jgi:hypothetical protein